MSQITQELLQRQKELALRRSPPLPENSESLTPQQERPYKGQKDSPLSDNTYSALDQYKRQMARVNAPPRPTDTITRQQEIKYTIERDLPGSAAYGIEQERKKRLTDLQPELQNERPNLNLGVPPDPNWSQCAETAPFVERPAYRVRFFFIRHGQSCSNIAQLFPKNKLYSTIHAHSLFYADPELSQFGKNFSVRNGECFKKYLEKNKIILHHIGASTMIRAIQTAWYFLAQPGGTPLLGNQRSEILILPYVSEKKTSPKLGEYLANKAPITASNMPLKYKEQLVELNMSRNLVDSLQDQTVTEEERRESSLPKFLIWFEDRVEGYFKSAGLNPNTDTMNFAIVCHGAFIKSELNLQTETENNSVFVKQYLFNKPGKIDYGAANNYPTNIEAYCPNTCRESYIPCPVSTPAGQTFTPSGVAKSQLTNPQRPVPNSYSKPTLFQTKKEYQVIFKPVPANISSQINRLNSNIIPRLEMYFKNVQLNEVKQGRIPRPVTEFNYIPLLQWILKDPVNRKNLSAQDIDEGAAFDTYSEVNKQQNEVEINRPPSILRRPVSNEFVDIPL